MTAAVTDVFRAVATPIPTARFPMRAEAGALAAAARARLRPVCPDWPPDQFAVLIADVVRFHERWDAWDTPGRHP